MSGKAQEPACCPLPWRARTSVALRERIGSFNAVMTAVEVADLVEDEAKVEIEVTAVIPD